VRLNPQGLIFNPEIRPQKDVGNSGKTGGMKMTEPDPKRIVPLVDAKTQEELAMEVFIELELEDRSFALLTPAEAVVNILRVVPGETEDDETLEEMEPTEFQSLRGLFERQLKEWNCQIEVRADEFLLHGDPPEEFYEDCEIFGVETEDGEEEYMILLEIDTGQELYIVAAPAEPPIYPVEIRDDKARSLNEKELAQYEPLFQQALEELAAEEEGS